MSTISKKELAQRVTKKVKSPLSLTESIISELLEETKKALIKGEEVRFLGYFSFKTSITKPRMAMNLQTKKRWKCQLRGWWSVNSLLFWKKQWAKKNNSCLNKYFFLGLLFLVSEN